MSYNPAKEYIFLSQQWDGIPRLDTLLVDYAGAEDNRYVREVTKNMMLSLVARVLNPSCQQGLHFDS